MNEVFSCRGLCVGLITRPGESSVVCLSVIVKLRQCVGPGPLQVVEPKRKKGRKEKEGNKNKQIFLILSGVNT